MAISVESQTIVDFFSNSTTQRLIIPLFQRPYLWGKDEVENFKNDLSTLPSINATSSDLFLGLIVLCPKDPGNNSEFQIIDGQQRVTTFSIYISILSDYLFDFLSHSEINGNSKLKSRAHQKFHDLRRCLNNNQSNLKLFTENESTYELEFLTIILTDISNQADSTLTNNYDNQIADLRSSFTVKKDYLLDKKNYPKQKEAKEKNSLKNYENLQYWVSSLLEKKNTVLEKVELIISLSDDFLNNVYVIPFLSKNEENAFALFETLNDRGLEVAAIDLIKSLCISKVVGKQRDEVSELWKKIFTDILNKKDGTVFLRYAFNSEIKFIRKNEIYKRFQSQLKEIKSGQGVIDFLVNLLNNAKNYRILKNKDENFDDSIEINNVIHLLKDTNSIQWITIGLAALKILDDFTDPKQVKILEGKIEELFLIIHKIIFFISIKKSKFNIVEEFFPEISREINGAVTFKDKVDKIDDSITKIENKIISESLLINLSDLKEFSTSDNSNSKLLLNYLRYKNTKNGNVFSEMMTLEHVYPKNPNSGEWMQFDGFTDDAKVELCTQIGNHLLLTERLNKSLQNKEFSIKKGHYISKKCEDFVVDVNFSYENVTNWDHIVIEKRSELIYDSLIKHLGI